MTRIKNTSILLSILLLTGFLTMGWQKEKSIQDEVKTGLNIGDKAPELEFKNPNGDLIALSDLRGQMVLIDFWASWCKPCRIENPNLVRTYHAFKDSKFKNGKGFTVYGVSLDAYLKNWQNAIEQDKLDWKNHVSDLKYWASEPASIYKVQTIPTNFLIDGDGIIVAKGLRGKSLDDVLSRFKKQ